MFAVTPSMNLHVNQIKSRRCGSETSWSVITAVCLLACVIIMPVSMDTTDGIMKYILLFSLSH